MVCGPQCSSSTNLICPALPWHFHTLQSLLQVRKDDASYCSPTMARLHSQQRVMGWRGGFSACKRTWLMCLVLWLSPLQSRDLDSHGCQIVTVLSTLKLTVNKHDERQHVSRFDLIRQLFHARWTVIYMLRPLNTSWHSHLWAICD